GDVKGTLDGIFTNSTFVGKVRTDTSDTITFDWKILPQFLIVGTNQVHIENVHNLRFPNLYGKLDGKLNWSVVNQVQDLKFDATIESFYYKNFFASKAFIYSD